MNNYIDKNDYNIKISLKEHNNFLLISRDYNNIHYKNKYAKLMGYNDRVVHGINTFLICLEYFLNQEKINFKFVDKINIFFNSPIIINDNINIKIIKLNQKYLIEAYKDNLKSLTIIIKINKNSFNIKNKNIFLKKTYKISPINQNPENLPTSIKFPLINSKNKLLKLFPLVCKNIGVNRAISISMLSTSVGMYWPGKYSLFYSAEINFHNNFFDEVILNKFNYDKRFSITDFKFRSYGINANIRSIFKGLKINQSPYKIIKKIVKKNEFKSQNALIIGGSRGLGEVTTKLILAGNGKVVSTYLNNKTYIKENFSDINNKKSLKFLKYNIYHNIKFSKLNINTLYYFASPKIERVKSNEFDYEIFSEFNDFYLVEFYKIIKSFLIKPKKIIVFYPSTTFINYPEEKFKEYIEAKKNGEKIAKILEKKYRKYGLKIIIKRLPPLLTDQNSENWKLKIGKNKINEIMLLNIRKVQKELNL
tara:strand:+ start:21283 stop:22716 length:1434 start_codon:yes stop_codon:yes gene_type:complete